MSIYNNKKIAIIGLSVEGVDAVGFFASQGASITCCDRRNQQTLGETYSKLSRFTSQFSLGDGYLSGLNQFDYIVRSPGVSLATSEIQEAIERGQVVTSLTKVFFQHCNASIIGVTGTKGKGTTSTLIYEMIKKSGKKVWLGGNVGIPLLSRVKEISPSDIVVLELSSFQLEDLTQSPHIAVVLKITQDHLANYDPNASNFHISREAYVDAKKSIARFQTPEDIIIYNLDDCTSCEFASVSKAEKRSFSRTQDTAHAYVQNDAVYLKKQGEAHIICSLEKIHVKGIHNLENIAAATLAANEVGVSLGDIQSAACSFIGLEHRLEEVSTVNDVTFVNDSFSTVPETTIAALQSYSQPKILIVGGSEKGSDYTELGKEIACSNIRSLILIGDMSERIKQAVLNAGYAGEIIDGLQNMKEIVISASQSAQPGDVVLLSPACASFGMFTNYKERGQQFKYEISRL